MRRPVIAGNWKLYKTPKEAVQFIEQLKPLVQGSAHCDIVVAPTSTALGESVRTATGSNIRISAQDLFWEKEGAFTGEVSASMLADVGCQYCIVGHSERRQYFSETNETVKRKTQAALAAGLTSIVCIGETLAEREAKQTSQTIQSQFEEGLNDLTAQDFSRIVVAYEPVWAIGTGRTATPEMAVEVHKQIRLLAQQKFGSEASREL